MSRVFFPDKEPVEQKAEPYRFTPEERAYFKWLHQTCLCCLTGYPVFELAHTGRKHMALKSHPSTVLPIRHELHLYEERNRALFWREVNIPDYKDWALRLYEIWEKREDPMGLLLDMQDKANKHFIAQILRGETK